MALTIKPKKECRWDLVSLGEVMVRFDPGERRIATARRFEVCEGGGEYNVARGLKRCFGLETAIVTAFVDDPVGRLLQDLIHQGGVDQSLIRWVEHDGVGRAARNGLNFTERGFGLRAPLGCSDRGHTADRRSCAPHSIGLAIVERAGRHARVHVPDRRSTAPGPTGSCDVQRRRGERDLRANVPQHQPDNR